MLLGAAACGEAAETDVAAAAPEASAAARPSYTREYVFVGAREGEPLVVPFSFRSEDVGTQISRTARGWLAHGPTWDPFLNETWRTPEATGVWKVLPRGPLHVAADGPIDLSGIWFDEGERRLRLSLGAPLSGWSEGQDARYRFLRGQLTLGQESLSGTVVEGLRIQRPPAGPAPADSEYDWLFLVSGDSLRLLLAEAIGDAHARQRTFAWGLRGGEESWWDQAQIRWLELRSVQEARRDIPLRWSYQIPEAGISGEVEAIGYDVTIGEERGGRREVEVLYTVEGWVERGGERSAVSGTIRHRQG